ncbi:MAG: hypothetical protein O7A98_08050 [Acidobacteria bacterium]|nr:hypothetical protein [Acidobacteriota bacterium]
MSQGWAETTIQLATIYTAIGILFGLFFIIRGIDRVDPAAAGASGGFRLLILPGTVALWPLLAWRWLRADGEPPTESNAHRRAAR